MEFRIGINLGDVMVEGEQIYGDGVNVAARLQSLADAGGILIAGTVYDHTENKLALTYEYLGEQTVKNISRPVRVWRVVIDVPSPLAGEARPEHSRRSQGEGVSGGAGSSKFKVQSLKPRRVSVSHRSWAVAAGLALYSLRQHS
jgi:hypothetical protein